MGRFLDATDIVDGRISASSYVTVSNLMQELHDKLSTDKALGATELKECFKLLKTGVSLIPCICSSVVRSLDKMRACTQS